MPGTGETGKRGQHTIIHVQTGGGWVGDGGDQCKGVSGGRGNFGWALSMVESENERNSSRFSRGRNG